MKKVELEAGQILVNSEGLEFEVTSISREEIHLKDEDGNTGVISWNELEEFDYIPKRDN